MTVAIELEDTLIPLHKTRVAGKVSNRLNVWRSCFEITTSIIAYALAFVFLLYSANYFTIIPAIALMALCIIRIFIVQHDCGHHNLFRKTKVQDALGTLLSVVSMFPYQYWRKTHSYHHAHFGVEGKFSIGSIELLTVNEYNACTPRKRFTYKLLRSPLFFIGIIPIFVPFFIYRSTFLAKRTGGISPELTKKDWQSFLYLNIAILFFYALITILFGKVFLLKYLISLYCAMLVGMVLFYIQHNYKESYVEKKENRKHADAALKGSSLFVPPWIMCWFIGNIGYHHLHHLYPKVPFYRLKGIHNSYYANHQGIKIIRCKDILPQFSYKLYDENLGEMITWKQYQQTLP